MQPKGWTRVRLVFQPLQTKSIALRIFSPLPSASAGTSLPSTHSWQARDVFICLQRIKVTRVDKHGGYTVAVRQAILSLAWEEHKRS